jgi:ppGpp synthetase/RelA/SpoT-type nucleotidyltranferase
MSDQDIESGAEWLTEQIEAYQQVAPLYTRYANLLKRALEIAMIKVCPGASVEARPKSILSFAEKALLKRTKYTSPLAGLTDLCGARVIAPARAEVAAISVWIEENFEISWQDSDDASTRLGPISFGYGSMHYVVSFRPGTAMGIDIPDEIYGLKAEIQIRTTLQHVWATLAHRLSYKKDVELPLFWQREFAMLAAELENAENAMERIEAGLPLYASGHRSYQDTGEINREIAKLRTVLRYDEQNAKLACRIASLATSIADWDMVVGVLTPFAADDHARDQPTLLTQLGYALCKQHASAPDSEPFRLGQAYLERAGQPPISDSKALSYLADTWRAREENTARRLYRKAFELDPANYDGLVKYLEHDVSRSSRESALPTYRPLMAAALERCQMEADMGINSPWPLYGMAKLQLLRGDPDESLKACCRAIRASTAAYMIEDEITAIERLSSASGDLAGFELVRLLLLVGAAAKFPSQGTRARLEPCTSQPSADIAGPVVVVAGGTDRSVEEQLSEYRERLLQAFDGYHGTIISGGTSSGVSGLVGDIGQRHAGHVRTIGYLPDCLPEGAEVDARYDEIRRTGGDKFSALEPLRYWADLLASGIEPSNVKLLGLNGGNVTAYEFRIALLVGALVGVIPESGRESDKLLADKVWLETGNVLPVLDDLHTMRVFIDSGAAKIDAELRETIGRAIHSEHRREQITDWDKLESRLRESSRLQADHIWLKLRRIGCDTYRVTNRKVALMTFTDDEVETLAGMEHGRWNAERLFQGWTLGETTDYERKLSPYLVPWAKLPEDVREWDRQTVRRIPDYLAEVQLEIGRLDPGKPTP